METPATAETDGVAEDPAPDSADPPPAFDGDPEAFVPFGPVGNAGDYNALIGELEGVLPAELRNEVPWPDTRNPDPVQAQLDIFDLWIWMAATLPEPLLAEIMAADASPSRQEIAGIFGSQRANGQLLEREEAPYRAFDHRVVTFETAGLPLWLARDVPEDAVVVYYQDCSGPSTIRDIESGERIGTSPGTATRQWLSIMVPTDVGWLLFRDQLIEPNDSELEVPEQVVPGPSDDSRQDV